MKALEESVRNIEKDGLVWGASKLIPVGYGVKKLQISLVVEDEKVSLQALEDEISGFEDYVQSTDIVSSQPRRIWINLMLIVCVNIPGYHAKAVNCSYEQSFSSRNDIRSLH